MADQPAQRIETVLEDIRPRIGDRGAIVGSVVAERIGLAGDANRLDEPPELVEGLRFRESDRACRTALERNRGRVAHGVARIGRAVAIGVGHAAYAARIVVSVARPGAVALRHFHDVADAIIGNRRRRRAARRGQRDAGQPSIAVIGERIDHAIGVGERGRLPQRVPRDPKVEQTIDI